MWWSEASRRQRRTALFAVLGTGLLAGCGFHIRQPAKLSFASIALAGFAPRSPLAEALSRELATRVRVLDAPAVPDVVLRALVDSRDSLAAGTTAAAQVRELKLRLTFTFRADTPSGRELIGRTELLIQRDLSYRETAALAKEYESTEIFRDMQADMVAQVLRRLASVNL